MKSIYIRERESNMGQKVIMFLNPAEDQVFMDSSFEIIIDREKNCRFAKLLEPCNVKGVNLIQPVQIDSVNFRHPIFNRIKNRLKWEELEPSELKLFSYKDVSLLEVALLQKNLNVIVKSKFPLDSGHSYISILELDNQTEITTLVCTDPCIKYIL